MGEYQWGARKGKQCIDVVLLKQLTYEIARLTRTSVVTIDNDAKSCFDRIVMCFAMHRTQQLGMPVKACEMLGDFLERAQYHIKTKLGVSKKSYSSTKKVPLNGPGQGNKMGPDLWKYVSTVIMQVLDETNPGLLLTDHKREREASRPIDGFVDNATAWAAKFLAELLKFAREKYSEEKATELLRQLIAESTELAQHWEQLLWVTGGELEISKCFYYIVNYKFDTVGRATLRTKKELEEKGFNMKIAQSGTGKDGGIKQKDCYEAHRTLGPMICPDNENKEEAERLLTRGNKLARNLRGSKLSKQAAFTFYRSMFTSAITYSLPAVYLTREQLEKVESQMIMAVLPKMGYNRYLPREVVFGPYEYGGIGLVSLYVAQGVYMSCQHYDSSG